MALTDEIAELLGTLPGLTYDPDGPDGNVFVDQMPSTPDRAACVYTSPGLEADSRMAYDPAEFQLAFRSEAGGQWAVQAWQDAYSLLHALRNTTLPGGTYLAFCLGRQSSPFRLGTDENGRPTYTGNYRTEIINPTNERTED